MGKKKIVRLYPRMISGILQVMWRNFGLVAAFLLFLGGCIGFSIDRSGGIVRYKDGEAYTAFGRFHLGHLPSSWGPATIRLKQLVFENDSLGATILADALCGPKFVDSPLPRLAHDLFDRMENRKFQDERVTTLDGRSAHYLIGTGKVDGVDLRMEAYVMKKDFCLYDLVYFAPPDRFARGQKDFQGVVHGFQTR